MFAAARRVHVPPRFHYAVAVAAVAVCSLIRLALDPLLGESAPFALFIPGIMFSAFVGGLRPGLLATALSLVVGHYFFTEPRHVLFALDLPHEPLSLLLYAVAGICISVLCHILRRSEESFRSLAEGMPHIVWETNAQGVSHYQNGVWYDYTGAAPGSTSGQRWLSYVHPDDRERLMTQWMAAVHSGGTHVCDVEARIRRHDGVYRWFRIKGAPVHNDAGSVVKWVGTCTDIDDTKRAEEELERSRGMLRSVLDTVPVRVFWKDQESVFLGCNRPFAHDAGCHSPEELIGKTDFDMGWHDQAELYRADDRRVMESGQPKLGYEEPQTAPDGRPLWLRTSKTPLRDLDGRIIGVLGTYEDITQSKMVELSLADAKRAAEVAQAAAEEACQAKDRFLAVLSHELRTPLTPVLAGVAMLQENTRLDGDTRDLLTMMRRNTELEAQLIDDLLDMTRIARGKVELNRRPVKLCEVLRHTVSICRPDIEARGLQFGVDMGPEAPYVLDADALRLQQVFWNLLRNAIKFTPHGGRICIRCRLEGNGQVLAEINDTGMGIEPQALQRIFNAFEQGEGSITRQFGGLGLGLAICKSLVELHGGAIEAQSDGRNRGATFRVRLPIVAAGQGEVTIQRDGSPAAVEVPLMRAGARTASRILLVEDHGDTAKLIKRLLEGNGHTVCLASDVATALELASSRPFDLLISDLGLPDGSGVDLICALRSRGCNVPGIALSGYGQEEDIRRSKEAGFATHMIKPTSPDRLSEAIASVLSEQA